MTIWDFARAALGGDPRLVAYEWHIGALAMAIWDFGRAALGGESRLVA